MKEMGVVINELHHKAMAIADEAFYAKRGGELEVAQSKYLEAFEFEKAAAMLLVNEYSQEPTRSVLFRSAACLMLNLPYPTDDHFRQSERMVAFGLSGNRLCEVPGPRNTEPGVPTRHRFTKNVIFGNMKYSIRVFKVLYPKFEALCAPDKQR